MGDTLLAEQVQVIDPSVNNPPGALAEKTPEELLNMITQESVNLAKEPQETPDIMLEPQQPGVPQVSQIPQVEVTTPVLVQADKGTTEGQPKEQAVTVPQPAVKSEIAELMAKKGLHTPEDIFPIYKNLEKKFTQVAQENARLLRQQTIPAPIPVQMVENPPVQSQSVPGLPIGYSKEQFMADLEADPLRTLAMINQVLNAPVIEEQREAKLHSKVVELSSSPKTAEFNLPIVQEEMTKIFMGRPDFQRNVLGSLEDVYDKAISRLYREGKLTKDSVEIGKKMAEQNFVQKQAAAMETSSRPAVPQPNSLWQLPADKQWEALSNLWVTVHENARRG